MFSKPNCGDCKHHAVTEELTVYECRLNPPLCTPIPNGRQIAFLTYYPKVTEKNSCAQFTPREGIAVSLMRSN